MVKMKGINKAEKIQLKREVKGLRGFTQLSWVEHC